MDLAALGQAAMSAMSSMNQGNSPIPSRTEGRRSLSKQGKFDFLKDQAIADMGNQTGAPGETMKEWDYKQTPIHQRPVAPNETFGNMWA